jgi:hypothetical protein
VVLFTPQRTESERLNRELSEKLRKIQEESHRKAMEHSEEVAQMQLQIQQKDVQLRAANNEKETLISEMESKVRATANAG